MDTALRDKLLGKFIVFDGPDGCGKTTQLDRLASELAAESISVQRTRDPGSTEIGDRIRSLLLNGDLNEMDIRCETFLFMASRAQLVADVIRPALEQSTTVLCDRFVSSTCAYQGAAGYDPVEVIKLGMLAVGETWPDLTCILDVTPEKGFERTKRKPSEAGKNWNRSHRTEQMLLFPDAVVDAMEARPLDFHRRVREIFRQLPELYPKPVVIVDADGTVEEVYDRIIEALSDAGL